LPINGFYLVEPDGKVDLGIPYGKVPVAGLTLDEAAAAVEGHLGKIVKDARASVTLGGWVVGWYAEALRKHPYRVQRFHVLKIQANPTLPDQPINGPHLVDPDGKVDLGPGYGRLAVAGLTLDEEAAAVEAHLRERVKGARASVSLAGWEKSWLNLEEQAGGGGRPGAAAAGPPRKEALRYGGKNFDQWRTELVTELKPEVRVEGIRALSAFGANGYGAEAAAAILEVMKGYDVMSGDKDDERVTQAGLLAVGKVGAAAVPVLRDGIRDANRNVRRFAVTALARGAPEAEAAGPALLAAMRDKDPYVRQHAIRAVDNIDLKAEGAIPALTAALRDDAVAVRIEAAFALRRGGAEGQARGPRARRTARGTERPAARGRHRGVVRHQAGCESSRPRPHPGAEGRGSERPNQSRHTAGGVGAGREGCGAGPGRAVEGGDEEERRGPHPRNRGRPGPDRTRGQGGRPPAQRTARVPPERPPEGGGRGGLAKDQPMSNGPALGLQGLHLSPTGRPDPGRQRVSLARASPSRGRNQERPADPGNGARFAPTAPGRGILFRGRSVRMKGDPSFGRGTHACA
jgi:hypothetical protein